MKKEGGEGIKGVYYPRESATEDRSRAKERGDCPEEDPPVMAKGTETTCPRGPSSKRLCRFQPGVKKGAEGAPKERGK